MKQGTGKMTSNPKDAFTCNEVNPGAVSQIGLAQGVPGEQLYGERSVEAPKANVTVHKSGSQGEHK